MERKQLYLIGLGLVLVIGWAWWSGQQGAGAASLKIGGAFDLTGMAPDWGVAEQNGATLALEEFRQGNPELGRQIALVSEDIAGKQVKAVTAVQKLINVDKVNVILGTTWLDTFGGAAPLADQFDTVMITPSASITAVQSKTVYQNVFSTWYRTDVQAETMAIHLASKGQKRVAILIVNDPFWLDLMAYFKQAAASKGMTVVKEYELATAGDFRTILHELKRLQPDAIFFGLDEEKDVFNFLKQKQEIYPEAVLYTESIETLVNKDEFRDLLEGVGIAVIADPDPEFRSKYQARFKQEPVFSASTSYDATNMILGAWAAGKRTTAELRDYLRTTTFQTVTFGTAKFDSVGGLAGGKFVMKVVNNGVLELAGAGKQK